MIFCINRKLTKPTLPLIPQQRIPEILLQQSAKLTLKAIDDNNDTRPASRLLGVKDRWIVCFLMELVLVLWGLGWKGGGEIGFGVVRRWDRADGEVGGEGGCALEGGKRWKGTRRKDTLGGFMVVGDDR